MSSVSADKQMEYILLWFQEFSELQKQDFNQVLVGKFGPQSDELLSQSLGSLQMADRPPSLFQCRMILFNKWFEEWSEEDKASLVENLRQLDADFIERFEGALSSAPAVVTNGTADMYVGLHDT